MNTEALHHWGAGGEDRSRSRFWRILGVLREVNFSKPKEATGAMSWRSRAGLMPLLCIYFLASPLTSLSLTSLQCIRGTIWSGRRYISMYTVWIYKEQHTSEIKRKLPCFKDYSQSILFRKCKCRELVLSKYPPASLPSQPPLQLVGGHVTVLTNVLELK